MIRFVPELDRALVAEATRHTHAIWSSGRELDDYTAHTIGLLDVAGSELLHYAGLVDGTGLVASMKRYNVALADPDGGAIPAVGIGAVFTRADARGRGLASLLIQEILGEARALGVGAAWLHAEIDPAFYKRLGFLELPGPAFSARASDLPAAGGLAIRPAKPDDVGRMLAWYEASFPKDAPWLRPARSPESWRLFTIFNGVCAWILSDGGADVGYLAAAHGDEGEPALKVDEWAAPGVPRERIWATVRAFAERAQVDTVTGWLRLDQAGSPFVPLRRAHDTVPMIKLLDPHPGAAAWIAHGIALERSHFGAFDYF